MDNCIHFHTKICSMAKISNSSHFKGSVRTHRENLIIPKLSLCQDFCTAQRIKSPPCPQSRFHVFGEYCNLFTRVRSDMSSPQSEACPLSHVWGKCLTQNPSLTWRKSRTSYSSFLKNHQRTRQNTCFTSDFYQIFNTAQVRSSSQKE